MRSIVLMLILVLFTGCATITRGSREAFVIETDPVGVDVRLSNGLTCITPCSLEVKRRPPITVTLSKEGYEEVTTTVESTIPGSGGAGLAGNVLIGGIIGFGVDAATGAARAHEPNPLVVKLVPTTDPEAPSSSPSER